MMNDLLFVLESTRNRGDWDNVEVTLPNIPNQRYVIGSFYSGEREGEELVFCREYKEDTVAISVDAQGQYWIEDCTDQSTANTAFKIFVNSSRVKGGEPRLLKSGDSVSLGGPETPGTASRPRYTFHVKERIIPNSNLQSDENLTEVLDDPNSPLINDLILKNIMSYLPVRDLKSARQVCKKWKDEASKALEKRGKVSFSFEDYLNPENSTRVIRYLHEMRDMKMRNLQITLNYHNTLLTSSGQLGQKMIDDLRKLLKSTNNFSTLVLKANLGEESDFLLFSTIFQKLGGKLVELELAFRGYVEFFPEVVPPFPLMTNLKKFAHHGLIFGDNEKVEKLVSLLVLLFSNNLEDFTCSYDFLTHEDMPKLKRIAIEGVIMDNTLAFLLALKNRLTSLKFLCCYPQSEEGFRLLEKLLLKHSPSLQTLEFSIFSLKKAEVKFPSFPQLVELELGCNSQGARISWETDLDYKEHFPSLRKLTVRPPQPWSGDDPILHAFS